MGLEQSNLIPMPAGFDYMTVTLRATDRIRLIYPTQLEINTTREIILQQWPKGIQQELPLLGSAYEFKLAGFPFGKGASTEDAIQSRKLAANLLSRYYNQGLKLLVSSDLTQTTDLTTWIFHREAASITQYAFACIGISSTDKLQFIGFPNALHHIFQTVVSQNWPKTIQLVQLFGDTLEIKLVGNPWLSEDGSESVQSRTLIKAIINVLDHNNWLLYGASNLKGTADTIFFRYDPNANVDESRLAGFVISLSRNDRLQVIDAHPSVVDCVRNVLKQHWPHGLQNEKQNFNADEFQLYGNPWLSDTQDGISARFVICKLFEALMNLGWRVQIAIDVTRAQNDKSIFTFQRCLPMASSIFCLSLHHTDRIRFINAPPDVIEVVSGEIRKSWPFGIEQEGPCGTCREIELVGNPWSYGESGHDGAHGRVMLCHVLKVCASIGWFIIVSADVSSKSCSGEKNREYLLDVHSWWFMQIAPPTQQFATVQSQIAPPGVSDSGMMAPVLHSGIGPDSGFSLEPPPYSELFKGADSNIGFK